MFAAVARSVYSGYLILKTRIWVLPYRMPISLLLTQL
jgi:hypothetical protein